MNKSLLTLLIWLFLGMSHSTFATSLTSITLDPEDSTGTTTNAPGAWSTNLADPLSQIGVFSAEGVLLNQAPTPEIDLGEISIPLTPGINIFTLVGNGIFPSNLFYGAVLFFDGVATPPQIAVYNSNGSLGGFSVQPAGNTIMGGANGGLFFDTAPGSSVYVAADGTKVEVVSFFINSTSLNTVDKVSYNHSGADTIPDTTALLILKVTPPPSNEEPNCSAARPSQALLWPPNQQFVPISILDVTDPNGDPVTITITSIYQDEAVNAKGSGNTAPDGQGIGTSTAQVRAERVGAGNGRVYHIGFTAVDTQDASCTGEVLVGVPHDQGQGSTPIDDGAIYDSTVIPRS